VTSPLAIVTPARRSQGYALVVPSRSADLSGGALARQLGAYWYLFPMIATIDVVGRVVVPKPLRDSLGLTPGS